MPETIWIFAVRAAGAAHFVTLACACATPIPRNWDRSLGQLPAVHRRFALAQNVFIGAVIVYLGGVSLALAPELVRGTPLARALCVGAALWWGGRLVTLPWLQVWPELTTWIARVGFALLHVECAAFGAGYLWLALRAGK